MTEDLDLTSTEEVVDQVVVRVWRLYRFWWWFFLVPLLFALPYVQDIPLLGGIVFVGSLWLFPYIIRERWRLTLTNKQVIARQLYPRPLTLLSRIYYFPLSKIEGLTVGPRAFRSILLVGIFVATNLGVTLLKSGLSKQAQIGYDLPDSIDALLLIFRGVTFLPSLSSLADFIEQSFYGLFDLAADVLVALGIFFIVLGFITVLFTIPRRYHLQIRVRHGADFRLSAGIPRHFWEECYRQLYADQIVPAPQQYKKWKFPWLKGEEPETNADLDEIIYINRFISIFAIFAGSIRLANRIQAGTLGEDVLLWMIVAATDIFIAVAAVVFSKKKNEMIVTNRRIIFAQEMQDISGIYGRRLYLMSDISRDDVAGFRIIRLRRISYPYLFLTVFFAGITYLFWDAIHEDNILGTIFIRLIFIFVLLLFATFIIQTYLEFNVKTKGGELWHLRHQLSNPLTLMRQLIGNDENRLLTTLLSNRLEEKEVVDTIQIIRAGDLGLVPKLSGDSKYFGKKYDNSTDSSRQVELDDLLLVGESIKFESNVSRGVPNRRRNLTIGTFFMLILSSLLAVPLYLTVELTFAESVQILVGVVSLFLVLVLVAGLWMRYYSLYRARILFSEQRAFFIDMKKPPMLLYLLGISEESIIEETLQNQLHSTYTSRQFSQQQYWKDLVHHSRNFFLWFLAFSLLTGLLFTIFVDPLPAVERNPILVQVQPLILTILILSILLIIWHGGNAYISLVRSLPKRVVHTQGIGSHFIVPFTSKEKADTISKTVWEGILTE